MGIAGYRITLGTSFKKVGRNRQRPETRGIGQDIGIETANPHRDCSVLRVHCKFDFGPIVLYVKFCQMMFTGKDSATPQMIQARGGVPTSDIDTFPSSTRIIVPLHCDAVSGIFTGKAHESRPALGPDLFQPDQTDACDGLSPVQLGAKGRGQVLLHDCSVDPEIDQYTPFDGALQNRYFHFTKLQTTTIQFVNASATNKHVSKMCPTTN